MNAMQRLAWFELIVSGVALAGALILMPWIGDAAQGVFGLMGLLGFSVWFVRKRGSQVVYDERDQAIALRGAMLGFGVAWFSTYLILFALVMWADYHREKSVTISLLAWLLWLSFAVFFLVKGLNGVVSYRRHGIAA